MAAEAGYTHTALKHFTEAVYIDLDNSHANTIDGVHIASTGGIWSSLVCGFAGMRDQGEVFHFDPRLPADWKSLSFTLLVRDRVLAVELVPGAISLALDDGSMDVDVRGQRVTVTSDGVTVPLEDIPAPAPSVFPSPFPTSGFPAVAPARA